MVLPRDLLERSLTETLHKKIKDLAKRPQVDFLQGFCKEFSYSNLARTPPTRSCVEIPLRDLLQGSCKDFSNNDLAVRPPKESFYMDFVARSLKKMQNVFAKKYIFCGDLAQGSGQEISNRVPVKRPGTKIPYNDLAKKTLFAFMLCPFTIPPTTLFGFLPG